MISNTETIPTFLRSPSCITPRACTLAAWLWWGYIGAEIPPVGPMAALQPMLTLCWGYRRGVCRIAHGTCLTRPDDCFFPQCYPSLTHAKPSLSGVSSWSREIIHLPMTQLDLFNRRNVSDQTQFQNTTCRIGLTRRTSKDVFHTCKIFNEFKPKHFHVPLNFTVRVFVAPRGLSNLHKWKASVLK